jgi:hypothetical protein
MAVIKSTCMKPRAARLHIENTFQYILLGESISAND